MPRLCIPLGAFLVTLAAYPQCKSSAVFATISQTAEVAPMGGGLSNDGRPLYIDQSENAEVNTHIAANLSAFRPILRPYKRIRFLQLNLSRPLGGAQFLGMIEDHEAEFHAHYKLDPPGADGLHTIHSVSEVEPDQTVASESVRIFFKIRKTPHVLLFGDWAWNTCAASNGAAIAGGPLTTPASITGLGDRAWRITSAPGSIGRLYELKDKFRPLDRGLYYFDFQVTFRPKL